VDKCINKYHLIREIPYFWISPRDVTMIEQGIYNEKEDTYYIVFQSIEEDFDYGSKIKSVAIEEKGCFIIHPINKKMCLMTLIQNIEFNGWLPKYIKQILQVKDIVVKISSLKSFIMNVYIKPNIQSQELLILFFLISILETEY